MECEKFNLSEITPGTFKCLSFIQGLTANSNAEISSRILSKLEEDLKMRNKRACFVKLSERIKNNKKKFGKRSGDDR